MGHGYIECKAAGCQLCQGYEDGYTAGKDKAAFEFQHHDCMAHAGGCGCEPCKTWAQAASETVKLLLQVRNEGVGSVDGLKEKLCRDPCNHDRCRLLFALELLYQQTKDEVDDHNARAIHDRRN